MRASVWALFPFVMGLVLSGQSCQSAGAPVADARADGPPARSDVGQGRVALAELFTSEGCSSCPPADALLADLARDPRVIPLSFHVDYWDQLGWPDRFSSPANTARQRAYADSFGTRSLYTPELVVGGVEGFVGSNRARARAAVEASLGRPASVTLALTVRVAGPPGLAVAYSASNAPAGSILNVALVDREDTTQVGAGENAGRTLRHVDVVRSFSSTTASSSGTVLLPLPPPPLPTARQEVVAFVQRPAAPGAGMPVLGVARAPIPR